MPRRTDRVRYEGAFSGWLLRSSPAALLMQGVALVVVQQVSLGVRKIAGLYSKADWVGNFSSDTLDVAQFTQPGNLGFLIESIFSALGWGLILFACARVVADALAAPRTPPPPGADGP